jgi:hypothetical protein
MRTLTSVQRVANAPAHAESEPSIFEEFATSTKESTQVIAPLNWNGLRRYREVH